MGHINTLTPSQYTVLTSTVYFIQFLSFIACMVSFGAPLHSISGTDLYWDHLRGSGGSSSYSTLENSANPALRDAARSCNSGGKAYLAFNVISFLILFCLLLWGLLRFFRPDIGRSLMSRARLSGTLKDAFFVEMVAMTTVTFLFLLSVAIWGGTCQKKSSDWSGGRVDRRGYGYEIACFVFLMLGTVIGWGVWKLGSAELFEASPILPTTARAYGKDGVDGTTAPSQLAGEGAGNHTNMQHTPLASDAAPGTFPPAYTNNADPMPVMPPIGQVPAVQPQFQPQPTSVH